MKLRPARPADISALTAIETALFPSDRLSARQFRYHMGNPRAFLRVAAGADGAVLGYVLLLWRGDAARLYSIAVAGAAQGRGLGGRLLAAAVDAAKRRKTSKISLEVRARSRKVVALYESFGFEAAASLPAYYGDGADALRMVKVLRKT
jgi:ribosomal protein S18 acetylase RimI-like enzyme